jgi:hypothetical protein
MKWFLLIALIFNVIHAFIVGYKEARKSPAAFVGVVIGIGFTVWLLIWVYFYSGLFA